MPKKSDHVPFVRVVSAEIVKPLDSAWEETGPFLHDLRGCMHRLLNSAITACAIASASGAGASKDLGQAARDAVNDRLRLDRESAQIALAKVVKSKDAQYVRKLERAAALSMSSAVYDTVARKAMQMFADWRKTSFLGEKSLPSFKSGAPIFIRDGRWTVTRDDKGYRLRVKLRGGRDAWNEFAIVVDGGNAHAQMRLLTDQEAIDSGRVRPCDLKLVFAERKKKWFANMTFAAPRPDRSGDPDRMVAVHRGMKSFLTVACSDGDARVLADGGDIVAVKKQMDARRTTLKRHKRELGDGAKGHGVARRHAVYDALRDKEARWVDTKCKQVAAAAVKYAHSRGASVVVCDDFGAPRGDIGDTYLEKKITNWPWAMLKGCIKNACDGSGLVFVEVTSAYESQTCPACDARHVEANRSGGAFDCPGCGYSSGIEVIAALNMLKRAGKSEEVHQMIEKGRQTAAMFAAVKRDIATQVNA